MRRRFLPSFYLLIALVGWSGFSLNLWTQTATPAIRWQFDVPVRLRDGVTLAANVYLSAKEGKYPVILIRTPYGKAGNQDDAIYFAEKGYAVVVQDARGRFESDGEWYAFRHEADDGYDTIEWAARQSWSNGKVVTYGGSYLAIDQWLAATRVPAHLAAMVSLVGPSDLYANTLHNGGSFQNGTALTWSMGTGRRTRLLDEMKIIRWPELLLHLPAESAAASGGFEPRFYRDWVEHAARDAYWQALSWRDVYPRLAIPIFHAGGWFDIFQKGTIENFERMIQEAPAPARAAQRLVMGAWSHGAFGPKVGEVDFGPQSVVDIRAKILRWLEHYIKGVDNGAERDSPVEIFVMGTNRWTSEETWPPADAKPTRYFFHRGGKANTLGGGLLSPASPS